MKTMTKLVSTFAVSLLLAACSGKSPEDTAQKFVSEIYNGNADAVVAIWTMRTNKNRAYKKC